MALTPKPARKNVLTDRECAKVLSGVILPTSRLFGTEIMRDVLRYLSEETLVWKLTKSIVKGRQPADKMMLKLRDRRLTALPTQDHTACDLVLGGLAGSLASIADPDIARKAVRWCYEHLDQIVAPPAELLPVHPDVIKRAFEEAPQHRPRKGSPPDRVFAYARKAWKGNGSGSTAEKTQAITEELPQLLEDLYIKSIVDVGCGTPEWILKVLEDFPAVKYVGVDVVDEVTQTNTKFYPNHLFRTIGWNGDWNIPNADIAICRDVLAHLSNGEVIQMIEAMKRAAPLLLITNYPTTRNNTDIESGRFRPLNLVMPPFRLPPPEKIIIDSDRKVLALFRTASL